MTPEIKKAVDAIAGKYARLDKYYKYYDGEQPLQYIMRYLRETFAGQRITFNENWCAVVVDAALDRLNLAGAKVSTEEGEENPANDALQKLWDEQRMSLSSDDVHEAVVVGGEGYVIVWPDAGGDGLEIYANDPRMVHVQYDPERPRKMLWAAKRWIDEDGYWRLTMYYPDRLEYYHSTAKHDAGGDASKNFVPTEEGTAPNPYGRIPVFHFRAKRRGDKSAITDVLPMQDAVNKLFTDMMIVAEYGAFPQRWISAQGDASEFKNAPNELWEIGAGSRVGQFEPADLTRYLETIAGIVRAVAAISRTPAHMFLDSAGSQVSGEALIALESPLNKRVQDYIDALVPTWREVFTFALEILGYDVAESDIVVAFDKPATVQPSTEATITGTRVASGVPLLEALRMENIDEAVIERIAAALDEEKIDNSRVLPLGDITRLVPEPDPIVGEGDGG